MDSEQKKVGGIGPSPNKVCTTTQCGNLRIFLSFHSFYVKPISLVKSEPQKLQLIMKIRVKTQWQEMS